MTRNKAEPCARRGPDRAVRKHNTWDDEEKTLSQTISEDTPIKQVVKRTPELIDLTDEKYELESVCAKIRKRKAEHMEIVTKAKEAAKEATEKAIREYKGAPDLQGFTDADRMAKKAKYGQTLIWKGANIGAMPFGWKIEIDGKQYLQPAEIAWRKEQAEKASAAMGIGSDKGKELFGAPTINSSREIINLVDNDDDDEEECRHDGEANNCGPVSKFSLASGPRAPIKRSGDSSTEQKYGLVGTALPAHLGQPSNSLAYETNNQIDRSRDPRLAFQRQPPKTLKAADPEGQSAFARVIPAASQSHITPAPAHHQQSLVADETSTDGTSADDALVSTETSASELERHG